jgi:hypothetical protein
MLYLCWGILYSEVNRYHIFQGLKGKAVARSLLSDIKTKQFSDMDMFKEWKRGDYQNKL